MPNQVENDYVADLERSRLEESLKNEESDAADDGSPNTAKSILGSISSIKGKGGSAGSKFDAAAKAVASGQYAVWQAMWDLLVPTFGLSLFLVYVPLFSWIFKKTFPQSVASKLPEPGEDGMLGFVPPPDPVTAKFVTPLYGIVNKITMLALALILAMIVLLLIVMIILPPFLMADMAQRLLGPLGEIISRILGAL